MTATYEVKAVGDPREWKNDYGVFLAYPVDLIDSEGKAHLGIEWSRKKDSKPPQIGDRVVADIQSGSHGDKLKVDFDATKELGGGGAQASSGGEARSGYQKSPDQQASIQRQVALKVLAPRICAEGLTDDVRSLVKELERFIGEAASGGGDGVLSRPTGNGAPASPAPSQKDETHWQFSSRLEEAGLNSNAARVVTDYALNNMSAEEQDAALSMLANPDRAKAAVKRLSEKAEAHYGSPLPSADPDEEIPF